MYFSVEFVAAGVDLSQPVVATCGSGVTAAHIALAAHTLGADIPVYDVRYSVRIYNYILCTMSWNCKVFMISVASFKFSLLCCICRVLGQSGGSKLLQIL